MWYPLYFLFQVKEQILNCKEAAVLCNALCGNHGADHLAFQEINKDDAFDATVNVAIQNGMYKNKEMCRICSSKFINLICAMPHSDKISKDTLKLSTFFAKSIADPAILSNRYI